MEEVAEGAGGGYAELRVLPAGAGGGSSVHCSRRSLCSGALSAPSVAISCAGTATLALWADAVPRGPAGGCVYFGPHSPRR